MDLVFSETLRIALALLFGAAAAHKARDLPAFTDVLAQYRLLPVPLVAAVAPAVVAAEISIGLLLAVPATGSLGATSAAVVLLLYSGAIAANLARGRREIDCGCGGPAGHQPLSGWLLIRNALLVAAALLAAVDAAPRVFHWLDAISISFGVATLVLVWNAANLLAAQSLQLARTRRSS